ncbi:MAG: hypothetical protein KGJ28_14375 [Alphaproteobacteria bacterium]|nr:hypothetical protein [Alphaproteobacteria bacterium]
MNKSQFVERAPLYYALAVALTFMRRGQSKALSLGIVCADYTIPDEDDPEEGYCLLDKQAMLMRAIDWLVEREIVIRIEDDFGDTVYEQSYMGVQTFEAACQEPELPFGKYYRVEDGGAWLRSALVNINRKYIELGITPEDFVTPDAEWEPLPLDRQDPLLQRAVDKLDETVEQVRSDNGYNAIVPEERNFVVQSLTVASETLKKADSTSVPFIRQYVLEPLKLVIRRFGPAALGVIATAAKDAVIEWLKSHGIELLASLFG